MKQVSFLLVAIVVLASCQPMRPVASSADGAPREFNFSQDKDTTIVQSLFSDKSSTISEENIQRLLDDNYRLPASLRIAVVRLETSRERRYFWNDEYFQKSQQSYLDSFVVRLRSSRRVAMVSPVPSMLITSNPSFTTIREAAVRMQCNMVVIYSVNGDYYSRYKVFSSPEIKAFASTELLLMDVRTGMVPFSATVTRDAFTVKKKEDMDYAQARDRVLNDAALASITEVGGRIAGFLGN